MNLKELALQLSAITVIANAAKETKDRLRREFADALDAVGERRLAIRGGEHRGHQTERAKALRHGV